MKDIGFIVFDLDGTLYDLNDVVQMNYMMQIDFYCSETGLSKNDVVKRFNANCIFPSMNTKAKSATEFFSLSGISIEKWNKYRERHFDVTVIDVAKATGDGLLEKFREIAPLVLLSSNSYNNIIKILNYLNIDSTIFDEIVCSDHRHSRGFFKKIDEMRLLAEKRKVPTSMIISIGDRYKTDIEPAVNLGGRGYVVDGPWELSDILSLLNEE